MSTTTPAVARWLLRQQVRMALWALAVLVVGVTVGTALVDRFTQVEISVVQFGRQGFVWFPFALAVILVTTYVPVHVAAGATRRSLGRATLLVALATGVLYTAMMTVALQVERWYYGLRGWPQELTDTIPLASDTSQVGWILVDLGLAFTAAQLSGLLVGAVYYRAGGWRGTLLLPLTVAPVLVVPLLVGSSLLDPLGLGVRIVTAVGLLAISALAYIAVLRRVQVRPATA